MRNSSIEWTDHTFNPWIGCTKVSPGCANCYAEKIAARFQKVPWGKGKLRKRTSEKYWENPLSWNRRCKRLGIRERVFCASMADVFDEEVPERWRNDLFRLIIRCSNLDWQILTKRPENALEYLRNLYGWADGKFGGHLAMVPAPNVWIGVSVENQKEADWRIPMLLKIPAAVRFLSMEPLLGPVNIKAFTYYGSKVGNNKGIDWVIVGGESGPGARPMHPDWARSLRDQCVSAKVPFLFKQWGEWLPIQYMSNDGRKLLNISADGKKEIILEAGSSSINMRKLGKKKSGRLLDGREWNEFPGHYNNNLTVETFKKARAKILGL